MLYNQKQLFKIIRGYSNDLDNDLSSDIMVNKHLSMMGIPSFHYSVTKRSVGRSLRLLRWLRNRRRRRYLIKMYRRVLRFKRRNQIISAKILKNEPYIITFKAFYSNFFIMLTDSYGNPLISCCTGQVARTRSKKRKNSLTLIHPMMRKVKLVLLRHRIRHLAIHIKTDISAKVITAIKFLHNSRYKFKISYMAILKPVPHHFGRRQRKPRRV